jgi:hypothetical protein
MIIHNINDDVGIPSLLNNTLSIKDLFQIYITTNNVMQMQGFIHRSFKTDDIMFAIILLAVASAENSIQPLFV